jgi:cell division septation protein DedD
MNSMRALLAVVLLLGVGTAPLAAQQPSPTLDEVEALTRDGRTVEARAKLAQWWQELGPKASRRDTQRGLWLRGQLTPDATQAQLDFRRLVVEYPGGPYSDLALLRLAQAAHASGDSATAAEQVAQLVREYPSSPVRREAEAWLATAGPVPAPVAGALPPDSARVAVDTARAPVNAVRAATDTARAPADTMRATAPQPGAAQFTVQLGAFSTVGRAGALLAEVTRAGFEGRLVRVQGSDLVRVRVGTFDSAEGAETILEQLRDRGFPGTVSRDAHREERVAR